MTFNRKRERSREHDRDRRNAKPYRGWYSLAIWCHPKSGLRALQLRRQPLCEPCLEAKPQRVTPATVVHHRRDHKGDWDLFIDPDNHASACKPCHDIALQREGHTGYSNAIDERGFPIDPKHPANARREQE